MFIGPTFKKKLRDVLTIGICGGISFVGIAAYTSNDDVYKSLIMPFIQRIDPEFAHRLSILALKYKLFKPVKIPDVMESEMLGFKFSSPVGMAAGFDKNGEAVEGLFRLGFGFVEVGSVTPLPQPGNPKPRVFRLPSISGIINRYGFNSDGHEAVYERLSALGPPGSRGGVLGVNLGKNKESEDPVGDYVLGVKKFGEIADYLVINVSSPNTPGLRGMQQKQVLERLISAVLEERARLDCQKKPPILLKVSPDLSYAEKSDIVSVISKKQCQVDGLIVSNTTVSRPEGVTAEHLSETGGLSGKPLKDLSTNALRDFALLTKGKIPLIGVGGVFSGQDAKEKIYAGASLIQVYSCFAYDGPPTARRLARELSQELRNDGFSSIQSAIGAKVKS